MADGKVKIDIEADDSKFQKTVDGLDDDAKKAAEGLDELGDSGEKVKDGLDAADVAAGNLVANGLSSLVSGAMDAVSALIDLADSTREYREDMAKLQTAFTTQGHSTDAAKAAYQDFYAILGESDRSVEAVNHLAELTSSEQELAQWSTIAAGVTAKFGDSLPIEGLTEAANETAKVGEVTGPLADALNWAGISEDEFNAKLAECNSEQERATLITETLNEEYAAAAEEYNKLTGSAQDARRATSDMEEAQANLGAAIEPVTTAWTNLKAKALEAITPAIQTVSDGIMKLTDWLKEHETAATIITAVVLALAAAIGVLAVAFGIHALIQTVTKALTALNITMLANPVLLIVAGVAALAAGFIYLWNNCEAFREFWYALWEQLKASVEPMVQAIVNAFKQGWELIKAIWAEVEPFFSLIWAAIVAVFGFAVDFFKNTFKAAWEAIKIIWDVVTGYFTAIWNTIAGIFAVVKAVLSGNFSEAWIAIKGIVGTWTSYFSGIWSKIKAVFAVVGEWFRSTFQSAYNAVSKIWDAIGEYFAGLWDEVKEVFTDAVDVGSKIVSDIKQGISDAWSGLTSWFNGIWDSLFNRSASVSVSKGGSVKAESHKTGLDYVPYDGYFAMLHKGERVLTAEENAAYSGLARASVGVSSAAVSRSMGQSDVGFTDLARAVGIQTAGINSLSAAYKRGSGSARPIYLMLDRRELGRAIFDAGNEETGRVGVKLSLGGA